MDVFSSAFQQMLFMFLFMLLGYTLRKRRLIPENSSSVLSKLENLVFMPCLVLNTFMTRCTIDNLTSKITFLFYSLVSLGIALGLALILTPFFAQKKEERGIYRYSFMVANIAFMGNAVVEGIFGEEILFDYLMFTLPINLFLNSICISWLMPGDGQMSWCRKWLGSDQSGLDRRCDPWSDRSSSAASASCCDRFRKCLHGSRCHDPDRIYHRRLSAAPACIRRPDLSRRRLPAVIDAVSVRRPRLARQAAGRHPPRSDLCLFHATWT